MILSTFIIIFLNSVSSHGIYTSSIPAYLIFNEGHHLETKPEMLKTVEIAPQPHIEALSTNQIRYTQPYPKRKQISLTGLIQKPTQQTIGQVPLASTDESVIVPGHFQYYFLLPTSAERQLSIYFPGTKYETEETRNYELEDTPAYTKEVEAETVVDGPNGQLLVNNLIYHDDSEPILYETSGAIQQSRLSGPTTPRPIQQTKRYYQDIYIEIPTTYQIEFGHVMETPSRWEIRYERNDRKKNRYQGKVKWADKQGGYGEHYWDLGHI